MKRFHAFMVLGFVIAVSLAIGFFMQREDEKYKRIVMEKNLISIIESKRELEINLNKQIEVVLNKVREKENLINYLWAKLDKEKTIRSKLVENLERTSTRLASKGRPQKTIELEKIVISSLLETEGRVLAVDKENDLVVVNLGTSNNVKNGDRVSIYRGDEFIVNAELVKVENRVSAAALLAGDKDIYVAVNDIARLL